MAVLHAAGDIVCSKYLGVYMPVCVRVHVRCVHCVWVAFVCCCFACDCVLELVVCRVRFARVSCPWLIFATSKYLIMALRRADRRMNESALVMRARLGAADWEVVPPPAAALSACSSGAAAVLSSCSSCARRMSRCARRMPPAALRRAHTAAATACRACYARAWS